MLDRDRAIKANGCQPITEARARRDCGVGVELSVPARTAVTVALVHVGKTADAQLAPRGELDILDAPDGCLQRFASFSQPRQ